MPVDTLDVGAVAAENALLRACEEVVDADGAVVRARRELGVRRAERYAPHGLLVRLNGENKPCGRLHETSYHLCKAQSF